VQVAHFFDSPSELLVFYLEAANLLLEDYELAFVLLNDGDFRVAGLSSEPFKVLLKFVVPLFGNRYFLSFGLEEGVESFDFLGHHGDSAFVLGNLSRDVVHIAESSL
jgi:hypothetical protein